MTTVDAFVADRAAAWAELEDLVRRARRRPERLGAAGVLRLGACYRAAAADLALARRRFAGDPVVARLEVLVLRARHLVYDAEPSRGSLREFVTRGYWRRVRERPALLVVAALLLLAPAGLAGVWAWRDPGPAAGLVPTGLQTVVEPRQPGEDLGIAVGDQAAFASAIVANNVRVTILAFAGGIFAGLGTVVVLLANGVLLGAVAGLATGAGNGDAFVALVAAHGVLELSCIVVAGAAGLRMGWALVDPGYRPRGAALRDEARAAVELVLGTAAFLAVAAAVEGFVTPAGFGLAATVATGAGLAAVYWALVVVLGRRPVTGEPAP